MNSDYAGEGMTQTVDGHIVYVDNVNNNNNNNNNNNYPYSSYSANVNNNNNYAPIPVNNNNNNHVNNNNKSSHNNNNNNRRCCPDCTSVPGMMQGSFLCILLLLVLECFSTFVIDQIDSADLWIEITDTLLFEEYAAIGWSELDILSSSTNGYNGDRTFIYKDRCNNKKNGIIPSYYEFVDWCTLETKGNEWHIGCIIRISIASVLIILFGIMYHRMYYSNKGFNNLDNRDSSNVDNLTNKEFDIIKQHWRKKHIKYYRINKLILFIFELLMLIWAIGAGVSMHLWNDNNPIYNFESVYWSMGLACAACEAAIVGITFLLVAFDFHRSL